MTAVLTTAGTDEAVSVRGTVRWIWVVVGWLATLVAVAAIVVGVLLPRAAGGTPYTVLTGSMTPQYPPGTLVVVRPVEPEKIAVGQVITYQLKSGEPEVVTHRVTAVRVNTVTRDFEFTTKGDANAQPDVAPVQAGQVRGGLWYAVPYLGRVNTLLSGHQRALLVNLVVGGLVLYAAAMVLQQARERRSRDD